jgi:hypothetical protein
LVQFPPEATLPPFDAAPSKISTNVPASPVPESVTLPVEFVLPSAGLVMTGAAGAVTSTVQPRLAGDWSVFPAASVARTWKVWLVSARPVYVFELVQAVKGPPSRLHSKVDEGSSAVKVNDAEVLEVAPSGPVVIVVFGADVSTVTVTAFDAEELLPAASIATAVYVCAPSATPVGALLHAPPPLAVVVPRDAAPSKTSTVAAASAVPERVTFPVLFALPSAGLVIAGAPGGVTSTVHVRLAGVRSVLPAGSVARTSKVCRPSARAL